MPFNPAEIFRWQWWSVGHETALTVYLLTQIVGKNLGHKKTDSKCPSKADMKSRKCSPHSHDFICPFSHIFSVTFEICECCRLLKDTSRKNSSFPGKGLKILSDTLSMWIRWSWGIFEWKVTTDVLLWEETPRPTEAETLNPDRDRDQPKAGSTSWEEFSMLTGYLKGFFLLFVITHDHFHF